MTWGPRLSEVGTLAELLAGNDHVVHPTLTREQLIAAGDRPVCTDVRDLQWWNGLTDEARVEVAAAAQKALLAADQVRLDADRPGEVVLSPALQAITTIRSAPAFVSVAGGERIDEPTMRCFGLHLDDPAEVAVLLEARVFPGISEFLLGTATWAAGMLTRFVLAPPGSHDPDAAEVGAPLGRVVVRRLQLFPPGRWDGGQRIRVYAGVTGGAVEDIAPDGTGSGPGATTEQALAGRILTAWRAAVDEGVGR